MQKSAEDVSRIPPHAEKKFTGEIFSVWQWPQKQYDGSTKIFEGITRPDYGNAVGVLPNKEILLIWDEQPDRDGLLTTPGGRIEDGEDPAQGTKREFREETGYDVGTLTHWFTYKTGAKVDYTIHTYIARDLIQAGEPKLDAGEKIETRTYSFTDFLRLGQEDSGSIGGPIRDWMIRIKLLEASLDKNKEKELYKLLYE